MQRGVLRTGRVRPREDLFSRARARTRARPGADVRAALAGGPAVRGASRPARARFLGMPCALAQGRIRAGASHQGRLRLPVRAGAHQLAEWPLLPIEVRT